jgi:hypothetical protein
LFISDEVVDDMEAEENRGGTGAVMALAVPDWEYGGGGMSGMTIIDLGLVPPDSSKYSIFCLTLYVTGSR